MCGCLSCPWTGDLVCNPGMCPDWELNQGPFGLQACTQSTELHPAGPFTDFESSLCIKEARLSFSYRLQVIFPSLFLHINFYPFYFSMEKFSIQTLD